MHALLPRKIKRYLTEPDQSPLQRTYAIPTHTPLTELKIHINQFENINEINIPKHHRLHQQSHSFAPLQPKIQSKRRPIKRLPDLSQAGFGEKQTVVNDCSTVGAVFKRSNPMFVVNRLYQMMRHDFSNESNYLRFGKNNENNHYEDVNNKEFTEFAEKGVKIQRPPRIIKNELSRLTQKSFQTRMICSQGKARDRINGGAPVQLLTFYNPKQGRGQLNERKEATIS